MRFVWPEALWLLLAVPALVGAYALLQRRKRRSVLRYASLSLIRDALGTRRQWRRHVPPLLFLLACAVTIVAIARPTAVVTLPSQQETIILAIDVSLSMRATDVEPDRIRAAQVAAKAFIQEQPAHVRIGIVSFAGTASLVQPPTRDREELVAAIDRFQLQRHTAIGSAIIVSLATVFPDAGIELEPNLVRSGRGNGRGEPLESRPRQERKTSTPVAPGSYSSAAIILLTDGRRTTGPDPLAAAKMAADHGVRVFTVGFGTAAGGAVNIEGWSIYMRFDEETLKAIAELTQGKYFHASNAEDLKRVYQELNARLVLEKKETELSALFTAAAALTAVASAILSLLWVNRIV